MNKIICKLCVQDEFSIDDNHIELNISDDRVYNYTFWDKVRNLSDFISNEGLDILYISLFVFGIDRIVPRSSGEDNWSRKIKAYIPVIELDKWNDNSIILKKLLEFLSGDIWEIEFRKRELTSQEVKYKEELLDKNNEPVICNKICMFSGGLDSFIGAIDILSNQDNKNILFVSHYGGGKGTKEYQDILRERFISKYNISSSNFYSFYAVARNGVEDTTRTRSLMFFAHAIAIASSINNQVELIIPENGVISLNIPLTYSRLGTSSTRTTHPYYLGLMQLLLDNLGIKVKISNPYQFFTKGEMITNCKDKDFLIKNICDTMSCSHPDIGRMNGESESCHCGYCLPCTIRRAAFKRANMHDLTKYRDYNFTKGTISKVNINSYRLGVQKFNPKYAFLNIQKSGPITKNLKQYSELYTRGMIELKEFLEEFNE